MDWRQAEGKELKQRVAALKARLQEAGAEHAQLRRAAVDSCEALLELNSDNRKPPRV